MISGFSQTLNTRLFSSEYIHDILISGIHLSPSGKTPSRNSISLSTEKKGERCRQTDNECNLENESCVLLVPTRELGVQCFGVGTNLDYI